MSFSVAVVGSGVIGLTSALFIQKRLENRVKVTIFAKEVSPNTTSDIAAGLWTPYLLGKTPVEKIKTWSKQTHDFVLDLWREGKAKEAGISLQSIECVTVDPGLEIPEWAEIALGFAKLPLATLERYSEKFGTKFAAGYTYVTFIWEASKFLPFLQQEFVLNGGEIVVKEIENFRDLSGFDLIVNCTGLQAEILTGDLRVQPIRGQIARVAAPFQLHAIFAEIDRNGDGFYVIPNQDCVILGGTHQTGDRNLKVDDRDKEFILGGCGKLLPPLKNARIFRHQVGLRPGRDEVRLELEEGQASGGGKLRIIHNYGHGGSGITLCIGCAMSTAEIAREVLEGTRSKL